jgi:broad specificity phosphatase PhoE
MNRRHVVNALLCAATLGMGLGCRPLLAQSPATTVIVVRHAEKAAQPAADPPLTAGGRARAHALAVALKSAGVTAVVTTQFARTKATAAPTADEFHLTPVVVPATSPVSDHARAVAAAVMRHAGGTVLVVGHSNTVAAIVAALGAPKPAELCDAEYDAMFVLTVQADGHATVIKARYGKATPVAAGCGNTML